MSVSVLDANNKMLFFKKKIKKCTEVIFSFALNFHMLLRNRCYCSSNFAKTGERKKFTRKKREKFGKKKLSRFIPNSENHNEKWFYFRGSLESPSFSRYSRSRREQSARYVV